MTTTRFTQINYTLATLLDQIKLGQIGLPEIQRPFVWPNSKVRDLFDSMYHGYPVGYLLFWSNGLPGGPGRYSLYENACPLTEMTFDRDNPDIRVAVLVPGTGIALSQDAGSHWTPLNIIDAGPIVSGPTFYQPRSAFYDPQPNPKTGAPSIYVTLHDSGIIRLDGPFPTIRLPDMRVFGDVYLPLVMNNAASGSSASTTTPARSR